MSPVVQMCAAACPRPGTGCPTWAAFCPVVPTAAAAPSLNISSCQISAVALGQVPTLIAPVSVSRSRQLLGFCYSVLPGVVGAPCCQGTCTSTLSVFLVSPYPRRSNVYFSISCERYSISVMLIISCTNSLLLAAVLCYD